MIKGKMKVQIRLTKGAKDFLVSLSVLAIIIKLHSKWLISAGPTMCTVQGFGDAKMSKTWPLSSRRQYTKIS